MSFAQILPEPAEVNSLMSHQLRSHCHLLSLSSLVVKAAGRTDQQERSGLQGAVWVLQSVFLSVPSPWKSLSSACKASPSSSAAFSTVLRDLKRINLMRNEEPWLTHCLKFQILERQSVITTHWQGSEVDHYELELNMKCVKLHNNHYLSHSHWFLTPLTDIDVNTRTDRGYICSRIADKTRNVSQITEKFLFLCFAIKCREQPGVCTSDLTRSHNSHIFIMTVRMIELWARNWEYPSRPDNVPVVSSFTPLLII